MQRALILLMVLVTAALFSMSWKQPSQAAPRVELAEVETKRILTFNPIEHLGGEIQDIVREKDSLYIARGTHLTEIDISSPNHPHPVSDPLALGSTIGGIGIRNNHIYVALGSSGLAIVTNNENGQLELVNHLTDLNAQDVVVDSGHLYVFQLDGVTIFGLSEPAKPQKLSQYGPVYDTKFTVDNGYLYIYDSSEIIVVDVNNPSAPSEIGRISVGWIRAFSVSNGKLYTMRAGELLVVDLANPSTPAIVGTLDLPYFATDIVTIGEFAYLDVGHLYVVDVRNPARPLGAGWLLDARHGRLEIGRLFRAGTDLIVTDASLGGLHLMDLSVNPAWPVEKGVLYEPGQIDDSIVKNGNLYLASGSGGVQVIDLADPYNLRSSVHFRSPNWTPVPDRDFYISPGTTSGIATAGGYVYMANREGGLHIVGIDSPTNVEIVGVFSRAQPQQNDMRDVVVKDGIAYVANGEHGLLLIDVSDPTAPQELTTLDTGAYSSSEATKLSVTGSYLVLYNIPDGIDLFSLANPEQPVLSAQWNGHAVRSFATDYPYIYVGTVNGLQILRITSDGQFEMVNSQDGFGVDHLYVAGDELYQYISGLGLRVLDISDPTNPVLLGAHSKPSGPVLTTNGDYIFIDNNGITTLRRFTGVSGVIDGSGLLRVPADGITYTFEQGVFPVPTEVYHVSLAAAGMPPPGALMLYGPFEVGAFIEDYAVSPSRPFTITIDFPSGLSEAAISDLILYALEGGQWVSVSSAQFDETQQSVTAVVDQMGVFALATNSSKTVFLPNVVRNSRGIPDLSIQGIEVTQASQNLDNGVPLTSHRPTVARVYVRTTGDIPINDVTLSLRATRDGLPLPGAITTGPRAVFPYVDRDTPFTSFDIRLPDAWLQGNVTLTAEVDAEQRIIESNERNNLQSVTVPFTPLEPLRVVVVPVNYMDTTRGVFCPAPEADDLYSDSLQRLFPVHDVELSFRPPISFSGNLASESRRLLEQVTAVKEADNAPAAVVYYGVFSRRNADSDSCSVGVAGMGWLGQRAAIGTLLPAADRMSALHEAGSLAAHEIGHNFGLLHAPCGPADTVDPHYPYPEASIGEIGYDVSRGRIWSVGHPDYGQDIMAYCNKDWFSDYNYVRLYQDQLENGRVNTIAPTPHLQIRASISGDALQVYPTYVITRTTAPDAPDESSFVIELVDDAGVVIASQSVSVYQVADEPNMGSIFASVPLPEKPVAMVRLLRDSDIVATRYVSAGRPNQVEDSPTLALTDEGGILRWNRTQTPVLIRYSTDQGVTWTTLAVDAIGGEWQLDSRQLPEEPALFEIKPADSMTLDAWTMPYQPALETSNE